MMSVDGQKPRGAGADCHAFCGAEIDLIRLLNVFWDVMLLDAHRFRQFMVTSICKAGLTCYTRLSCHAVGVT